MKTGGLLATRRSLVDRLANWDDQRRWQEFFDTYWKLIYSAARKSGLADAEAQEVVQETVITVAKNIDKLKYDPAIGSFKGWLLQITRWRIADEFRNFYKPYRQLFKFALRPVFESFGLEWQPPPNVFWLNVIGSLLGLLLGILGFLNVIVMFWFKPISGLLGLLFVIVLILTAILGLTKFAGER